MICQKVLTFQASFQLRDAAVSLLSSTLGGNCTPALPLPYEVLLVTPHLLFFCFSSSYFECTLSLSSLLAFCGRDLEH